MTITASPAWAAANAHRDVIKRRIFAGICSPPIQSGLSRCHCPLTACSMTFPSSALPRRLWVCSCLWPKEALFPEWTERMFSGERINISEGRSVLHTALRRSAGPFPGKEFDVMPEVIETRRRMAEFAERLRSGKCFGHKGMPIRDVVNIGIGGSDLGPKMMNQASP